MTSEVVYLSNGDKFSHSKLFPHIEGVTSIFPDSLKKFSEVKNNEIPLDKLCPHLSSEFSVVSKSIFDEPFLVNVHRMPRWKITFILEELRKYCNDFFSKMLSFHFSRYYYPDIEEVARYDVRIPGETVIHKGYDSLIARTIIVEENVKITKLKFSVRTRSNFSTFLACYKHDFSIYGFSCVTSIREDAVFVTDLPPITLCPGSVHVAMEPFVDVIIDTPDSDQKYIELWIKTT
jgi:hypothetical protein